MTTLAQQLLAKAKAVKSPDLNVRREEYKACLPATEHLLAKGQNCKQITEFLIANLPHKERPKFKTPAWWRLYGFVNRVHRKQQKASQPQAG